MYLGNKKGHLQCYNTVVFRATLASIKRALFVTKKGTFGPSKKFAGWGARPPFPTHWIQLCFIITIGTIC